MNKNELVKAIAKKVESTGSGGPRFKPTAGGGARFKPRVGSGARLSQENIFLDAFVETVSNELRKKGKVTIAGLGTFTIAHRKEKRGVNPKTGEKITIKAKNVPVFKPGKALKMMVK